MVNEYYKSLPKDPYLLQLEREQEKIRRARNLYRRNQRIQAGVIIAMMIIGFACWPFYLFSHNAILALFIGLSFGLSFGTAMSQKIKEFRYYGKEEN